MEASVSLVCRLEMRLLEGVMGAKVGKLST